MTIPDWINEESASYDSNWMNRLELLSEPVYTQFSNGSVHTTSNRIHLARWIADGATVIDEPETEDSQSVEGEATPSSIALVGEPGPEPISLPLGTQVIPNDETVEQPKTATLSLASEVSVAVDQPVVETESIEVPLPVVTFGDDVKVEEV